MGRRGFSNRCGKVDPEPLSGSRTLNLSYCVNFKQAGWASSLILVRLDDGKGCSHPTCS